MKNLKVYNIASINVKTQGINFKKGNQYIGERNVRILANFIQTEDLYSVGMQELTYLHQQALANQLFLNYIVSGKYCFGKGKLLEKILFNESNAIATRAKDIGLITSETQHLPSAPTIHDAWTNGFATVTKLQPRIVTSVVDHDEKIIHINTHLHDAFEQSRREQQKNVYYYVQTMKLDYPDYDIVLTGDFNAHINQRSFKGFVANMEKIGFERVPIDERTFHNQEEDVAIDHIFLSEGFTLQDYKVCDTGDITTTTDHYPIIAKVKRRK